MLATRTFALLASVGFADGTLARAQCANWVPRLSVTSIDGPILVTSVHDDGGGQALYVGGNFTSIDGLTTRGIARWRSGEWSIPGGHAPDGNVQVMNVLDDGNGPALHVAGTFTSIGAATGSNIAKWDGSGWQSLPQLFYGPTPVFPGSFAYFDDGSGAGRQLYAATSSGCWCVNELNNVWKLEGGGWVPLAPYFDSSVRSLVVFDDGSGEALYALGKFTHVGARSTNLVARWDGAEWSPVPGLQGGGEIVAATLHDDGAGSALYVAGRMGLGVPPGTCLARWNGSGWQGFGTFEGPPEGGNAFALSVAAFDDGGGPAVFVAGRFSAVGGVPATNVARLQAGAWSPLGSGTDGIASSLAALDQGPEPALVVAGPFLHAGGQLAGAVFGFGSSSVAGLARWRGCLENGTPFCFGDGSAGTCPCANSGAPGHGCENSSATGGARMQGSMALPVLVLATTGELASATSILLQGDIALASPAAFGDGLLCAGGNLLRLFVATAGSGAVSFPPPGAPSIADRSAALGDPLTPGAQRRYQTYYRDPSPAHCPPPLGATWNASNGLSVVW